MNDTETVGLGDKAREAGKGPKCRDSGDESRSSTLHRKRLYFKSSLVFSRLALLLSAEDGPWCP